MAGKCIFCGKVKKLEEVKGFFVRAQKTGSTFRQLQCCRSCLKDFMNEREKRDEEDQND